MRPYDVRTEKQLLEMSCDNYPADPKKWSLLIDGYTVGIHQPEGGGFYAIPIAQFNALVDWYMRDQPALKARKRANVK